MDPTRQTVVSNSILKKADNGKQNVDVNTRPSETDGCTWRGWLHKLSQGIMAKWQQRWFEVRREEVKKRPDRAILKYFAKSDKMNADLVEKKFTVIDARRETRRVKGRGACVSVEVKERKGRLFLSANSAEEADILLSDILSILAPASQTSEKVDLQVSVEG